MAALTYTARKQAFVQPNRNYDYLYDPNFHVSSDRDHAKESFKAHTSTDRIRYVPHFRTMFSSLRHYPRQTVTLDITDPVPAHISRQWGGYRDQARQTIVRYKKFNYNPDVQVPPCHFEPADVDGKNRYKYVQRPIIPFLPQMPPNVVLAKTRVDPLVPPQSTSTETDGFFSSPETRTVHVQTDYRETETQTDPYSPEYVVRPGSQPELLTLCSLSYGHGLPAGLAEVEMIERARAKRAWEASLPPLYDLDQMDKRRRMMEEQERREWSFREQEIEKMQEERMELVKKMLKKREVDHQALNSKRMELLWSKKQLEKNKRLRRLHSDHVKALRKLTENVEGKLTRRNIIKQYTNFDSQVYAPMTRIGVYMDSNSELYNVKSRFTTTLEGLMELEESLPLHNIYPIVRSPVRSGMKPAGMKVREDIKMASILEKVHSDITKDKTKGKEKAKPLRLLRKVIKPVPRPPTPAIPIPEAGEEEKELALILLQRVIRGRAIQTKMFEGKDRRQELIKEMRTTHALQLPEQKAQHREDSQIRAKQRTQEKEKHKASMVEDALEAPAASLIGQRIDFLNKELVRLQEERHIAAFVMLAERKRRIREAEESGRRQREERLRRTEDEIFKQMMRVHQGSIDMYLEDVILQSMELTADIEARRDIAKRSQAINEMAHNFEHTELSGKEFIAEMVHSFLLPEVEKRTIREKVCQDQQKHLLAAHRIIYKTVNDVFEKEDIESSSLQPSDPVSPSPGTSVSKPKKRSLSKPSTPATSPSRPPETGVTPLSRPPETPLFKPPETGASPPETGVAPSKSPETGVAPSKSPEAGIAPSEPPEAGVAPSEPPN